MLRGEEVKNASSAQAETSVGNEDGQGGQQCQQCAHRTDGV